MIKMKNEKMFEEQYARVMDDPKTEKYCFADQIEFILYAKHCKDAGKKNGIIWSADSTYHDLYMRGYNLFERGQYAKALWVYQDALKVNPVGIGARFEICECYLRLGMLLGARQTLLDMQEYLIEDKHVARFYRRLGFIATEQGDYRLAIACLLLSQKYEETDYVKNELMYIASVTGRMLRIPNPKAVVKAAGLPILAAYSFEELDPLARRADKVESV